MPKGALARLLPLQVRARFPIHTAFWPGFTGKRGIVSCRYMTKPDYRPDYPGLLDDCSIYAMDLRNRSLINDFTRWVLCSAFLSASSLCVTTQSAWHETGSRIVVMGPRAL